MKKIVSLFLCIIVFGCSDENGNSLPDNISFNTKEINLTLVLPSDSTIETSDLKVSSLFTFKNDVTNNEGYVVMFDNDALELTFATNDLENIILMGFINPNTSDEFELNSTTTAVSLVMLHPWLMELSTQAREEAYNQIILLPEFEAYHNTIIQEINSNTINPLTNQSILQSITTFQGVVLDSVEIENYPLTMLAENESITVTNSLNSLAYSLQLYDELDEPVGEEYLVDGVNKEIFSWASVSNFLTGNLDVFQPQDIEFPTPEENQEYILRADNWQGKAAWRNGAKISSSIIGVISPTLKDIIDNADCTISVGTHFLNVANATIEDATNNQLSSSETLAQIMTHIGQTSEDYYNIIKECGGYSELKLGFFSAILNRLSIADNFENATSLALSIYDIIAYDSEIEFCFRKNSSEITDCNCDTILINSENLSFFNCESLNIEDVSLSYILDIPCSPSIEIANNGSLFNTGTFEIDFSLLQDNYRTTITVFSNCGSGCLVAYLYENDNIVQTLINTNPFSSEELIFDNVNSANKIVMGSAEGSWSQIKLECN